MDSLNRPDHRRIETLNHPALWRITQPIMRRWLWRLWFATSRVHAEADGTLSVTPLFNRR